MPSAVLAVVGAILFTQIDAGRKLAPDARQPGGHELKTRFAGFLAAKLVHFCRKLAMVPPPWNHSRPSKGVAAPLNMINVDTDMIIPKQYLKTIQRTGLGKALFDEMRFNQDGSEKPDFVLNKPAYRKAKILVAGENFGCGSSREHAPWALLDFGIRCVIAPSFADIFYGNCFKNGILPIKLPQEIVDKLMDDAERGANAIISIDLEKPGNQGPRRRHDQVRGGCLPQAVPAEWLGRYRPDHARRRQDRVLRERQQPPSSSPGFRSVRRPGSDS